MFWRRTVGMLSAPERADRRMAMREVFLLKADIDLPDEQLRALRDPSPADGPPADAAVSDALRAATGNRPTRISADVRRGTFRWVIPADLADGRRVVLRANRIRSASLAHGLQVEAALGPILRGRVAAPAPYAIDVSCLALPVEYGVFERWDGSTLSSLDGNEAAMLTGLETTAAYLRRVHDITLPGAGGLDASARGCGEDWAAFLHVNLDNHIARCASDGAIDGAESGRIRILLDAELGADAAATDRLLHGDPGPENTILDANGGVTGMTDWEDALVGDPLFDVASIAAFQPERRWPAIFRGYFGGDLPVRHRRSFWLYAMRLALARTVMRARFGVNDLPGRAPAAGRIRRAQAVLEGREQ
jgi:aminoglycoside phosphotransferase (APT) family kinase protein